MTAPRFTLDTLQNIHFPGEADAPADYTYTTSGGQSATLSATPEELTAEEQGAALAFILKYCRAQSAKRGGKRRRATTAADLLKEIAEYRFTLDEIEAGNASPDYSQMFDCTELERLLAAAPDGSPDNGASAGGAGTTGNNPQNCFHGE